MPDDKSKVGEPDRSRLAADQDYEVRQLAEKHWPYTDPRTDRPRGE
jgi:hypothetical protein